MGLKEEINLLRHASRLEGGHTYHNKRLSKGLTIGIADATDKGLMFLILSRQEVWPAKEELETVINFWPVKAELIHYAFYRKPPLFIIAAFVRELEEQIYADPTP